MCSSDLVSAAVGRRDICDQMAYGATSDTWSANPLSSAAVLATLDEFETTNVLQHAQQISRQVADGLRRLKQTGLIVKVRGEGMVFGIECGAHGSKTPAQTANAIVERCYRGNAMNEQGTTQMQHFEGPEKPELPDRLPPALRLSQHSAVFALVLGLTFWFCCLRPVWHKIGRAHV